MFGQWKRALKGTAGGGCGPGLRLLRSQNFEEERIRLAVLNTPLTHQGGLADSDAAREPAALLLSALALNTLPTRDKRKQSYAKIFPKLSSTSS